jgi:hypothetical protein
MGIRQKSAVHLGGVLMVWSAILRVDCVGRRKGAGTNINYLQRKKKRRHGTSGAACDSRSWKEENFFSKFVKMNEFHRNLHVKEEPLVC